MADDALRAVLDEVHREHRRQETIDPNDVVDVACSRCYIFGEGWPCMTVRLAIAAEKEHPMTDTLIAEGIEAFRLTREYVGEDTLPAAEGWAWFDWTEKARAATPSPGLLAALDEWAAAYDEYMGLSASSMLNDRADRLLRASVALRDHASPAVEDRARLAYYTSPAGSTEIGGRARMWDELSESERDHWRRRAGRDRVERARSPLSVRAAMEALPTFEVGQVVGDLHPGRRRHDWCSIHGDLDPSESIHAHALSAHGVSSATIERMRETLAATLREAGTR